MRVPCCRNRERARLTGVCPGPRAASAACLWKRPSHRWHHAMADGVVQGIGGCRRQRPSGRFGTTADLFGGGLVDGRSGPGQPFARAVPAARDVLRRHGEGVIVAKAVPLQGGLAVAMIPWRPRTPRLRHTSAGDADHRRPIRPDQHGSVRRPRRRAPGADYSAIPDGLPRPAITRAGRPTRGALKNSRSGPDDLADSDQSGKVLMTGESRLHQT